MPDQNLRTLFLRELKDTYSAENAIVNALPKMAAAAQSADLKGALGVHLEETKHHVQRLENVFGILQHKPEGTECKAMNAIIQEGEEIVREFENGPALDAGLISAAQAVEHYEISRYGTLLAWAQQLGLDEAKELLKETLVEEENADELLSELAEDNVNPSAASGHPT